MASEVEICNEALTALGENMILSLTDNSKPARLCNLKYANKRDYLLRRYQWKFATRRVTLAPDVDTPDHEFSAQFTLPTDCVQFRAIYPNTIIYRIEDKKILCNESVLYIKYTYRVIDPNKMDATFMATLSALISRDLAIPLSESTTKRSQMDEDYEVKLSEARFASSIEDDLENLEAEDWVDSRN